MQNKRPLLLSVCAEAPSNIEHLGVWGASIVKADITDMGVFLHIPDPINHVMHGEKECMDDR